MTMRLAAAFALLLAPLSLRADEAKLKQADVPPAVLDAARQKHPQGKMVGFEKERKQGQPAYEIKLQEGKAKLEVVLTPEGKILKEEWEAKLSQAPAEVRRALFAGKYASWKVRKVERVITAEDASKLTWEISVSQGKQEVEIYFDPSGKTLAEEKGEGEGPEKR